MDEYRKRDLESDEAKVWTYFNPANLFLIHEREREILKLLALHGLSDLTKTKILDVGCGTGALLRRFIDYGAQPFNLYGIDLMEHRVKLARETSPNITFILGNAEKIDFPDKSFDIITQFTCFSSVLNDHVKAALAKEMLRVLKDDGLIVWYDMRPSSYLLSVFLILADVLSRVLKKGARLIKRSDYIEQVPKIKRAETTIKAIGRREIISLFSDCEIQARAVSLYFPLASLSFTSWILSEILLKLQFLRTHYLISIRKRRIH
ncbi:MAG: class I SAM-dependent methyltransferase [Thermodesulfobacteriota bacterium]|nr:class I SAM-dependent methyltransferase [Thermodesulfobacteriota bacterium]